MAAPDLDSLTGADVVALPLPELGMAVLAWAHGHNDFHVANCMRKLRNHLGKDQAVYQALCEAWDWLRQQGLVARSYSQSEDTFLLTRAGQAALGQI